MSKSSKIVLWIIATLIVVAGAYSLYSRLVMLPKDFNELSQNPDGVRAGRVMLLTLPEGTTIPVNYLREGSVVFVGADGRWWRDLQSDAPEGVAVTMLIRGQTLVGRASVVLDNPDYTHEVFARLRPAAPAWLPDWLNGKLIVIKLQD